MSFEYKSVNKVDPLTKYTVSGYIRNIQSIMPIDIAYYFIPEVVIDIILAYYWLKESFFKSGPHLALSDEEDIVYMTKRSAWNTAYGLTQTQFIPTIPAIYIWKFKLNCDYFGLGIDAENNDQRLQETFGTETANHFKYLHPISKALSNKIDSLSAPHLSAKFDYGDTITMELDTHNKHLKFYKNDQDVGVMFENIPPDSYRMAFSISGRDDSTQLLAFDIKIKKI